MFAGTTDGSGGGDVVTDADGSSHGNETNAPTSDDTADATDEGTSEPGGPQIFELFADPSTLREDDVLTLTAHVTDPDGLDDIVGGVLVDASPEGGLYGSFIQISEGSFEVLLTWDSVNDVAPISFEWDGTRSFRAEFVDKEENLGTRTIEIPFDCGGPDFGVCGDATCRQLGTYSDCEGCNDVCGDLGFDFGYCEDATCLAREWSSCITPEAGMSCTDVCVSQGYAGCLESCWSMWKTGPATVAYYDVLQDCQIEVYADTLEGSCDGALDPGLGTLARCCCGPL